MITKTRRVDELSTGRVSHDSWNLDHAAQLDAKGTGCSAKVSVVIPLYNEEDVLPKLYERLISALKSIPNHEIVFVNDGSRDRTLSLLLELSVKNDTVIVVDLSRNFGHQAAVLAGLEAASGDAVVLMDGDLQDPPEVIPSLVRAWREGNAVVIAHRRSRGDTGLRGFMFKQFYRVFDLISDFPIQPNAGIFSLMDRQAVDELLRFRERNRYLPGLRSWIGFEQTTVLYDRAARAAGEPKQTFGRLMRYALDAIFSFSYKPLRVSWAIGLLVSVMAFLYGTFLIIARALNFNVVRGFTTTAVAVLFLGGLQMIMIGILGEYLARIYDEVKQRPSYIVARRLGSNSPHLHEATRIAVRVGGLPRA